jgi:DNA-binding response OmpR family regulator
MPTYSSILLIEDSPGECELFHLALAQTGLDVALHIEQDGEAALRFLKVEAQAEIKLILLDWHLRNHYGDEFLRRLRAEARFTSIPVVCFTTSDTASDLTSAYENGANGYVTKPGTYDQLVECVRDLCGYWLKWNRTGEVLVRC